MEQQSGNNFDALFQKAAEDYPLKTDNGNWDMVAAKLRKVTTPSSANKSRRWQYAAMLLLLLSISSLLYFSNKSVNGVNRVSNNQSKITTHKSAQTSGNNNQSKQIFTDKSFQNQFKNNIIKNGARVHLVNQSISKNNILSNTQFYPHRNFIVGNKTTNTASTDVISNTVSEQSQPSAFGTLHSHNESSNNEIENNNVINNKNIFQLNNENAKNTVIKNDKPDDAKGKESQHVKLAPQQKLLYGELFFAPDFSTVKLQNVDAPGYNVGIGIGYKFSKRFSAELGLERLHTDFYSNAKYLDKSHLKLKPNTTVQFVNGKSKLTEVPFDIKYNLSKSNDHFFVTMGTTVARITHTERYNYRVIKDGTQHEASKHFGALTGTKFFSDLNFSAGYQTKLSGSFNLKVEPYYQIPLKGLGVGNLPVTNFGISIGIIKNLE